MNYSMVMITVNDVAFELREDHSFDWIQHEGRVFRVFAGQDSGNISC
ncbi:hypothetical protein [Paenibacillus faecalis]|nr:hypothetical protein [Paenibacillus faecalis]